MIKLISLFIMHLLLFQQTLFSQNYFGDITDVPIYYYTPNFQSLGIYFGVEKISTDYLDLAITLSENDYRIGQYNTNNGNGTYGNPSIFFNQQVTGQLKGNMFIKLRTGSTVKDFVVGRDNGLQVHWNQSGGITSIQQNITNGGSSWLVFESGIFDASDNAEDVLVSNGSTTLYYLINNKNGYLQNPVSVSLPHPFSVFKLRQLNEKTDGYVQYDPLDRSDIIFFDQSQRDQQIPDQIYAYLNNNNNGFQTGSPFASFSTDKPGISGLEVADLDEDGYNDVIVICDDAVCPTIYYARAYRNAHGQFINENTLFWSHTLNNNELSCGSPPKVTVADLNKDGYNDMVFVMNNDEDVTGIRIKVFINQYPYWPLFTADPQENFVIEETEQPALTQAITADIYGGQEHDGGGIALLAAYYFPTGGGQYAELKVKVVNATQQRRESPPPPPIIQKFLKYDHDNIWHPHIHLNNRGERDFDHFEIWKFKAGWPSVQHVDNTPDTGWTDYSECVDATGEDNIFWNCYYYAKMVDFADKVSSPSKIAYYLTGCVPVCDGCGGDNITENLIYLNTNQPLSFNVFNYPNPFNPITNIQFTLPVGSKVTIKVYNAIGQVIKELSNQWYEAGVHIVKFDGSNLPSGVYFYRIESASNVLSKKMLLIK